MMKHIFFTFLAAILLILPSSAAAPTTNAFKAFNSIVKTYAPAQDEAKGDAQCTAFAINLVTYLTAAHCTEDRDAIMILKGSDAFPARVVKVDKKADIAMARADVEFPTAGLSFGPKPSLGDKLYVFGFPMDVTFPVFYEVYGLGEQAIPQFGPRFVFNHQTFQGMSGGPVVDESGRFVSITQMGSPFVSLGATHESLKKFLR